MKLFRDEAVNFQRSKLLGDVVLNTPIKYSVIIGMLLVLMLLSMVFLFTQEYRHKQKVVGFLMPKGGLTTIIAEQSSFIQKFSVEVGDNVSRDQNLVLLSTAKSLSSGKVASEEIVVSLDRELEQIDQRSQSMKAMYELQTKVSSATIKKISSDLELLNESKTILLKSRNIKASQLSALSEIAKKGFATKRDTNEEELKFLDIAQRSNTIDLSIISKQQELNDIKNKATLDSLNLSTSLGELEQQREKILQQKINLDVQQGYAIRSPVDGVVTSIFETVGANLIPGKPILTIQPKNSELIARLAVPSRAIGLIAVNQEVLLYYEAFPYQQFGVFKGNISSISLNVINPRQFTGPIEVADSFYFVDVKLSKSTVFAYGNEIPLLAGMKLDADVVLEKLSLFDWLMSPVRAITKKYE